MTGGGVARPKELADPASPEITTEPVAACPVCGGVDAAPFATGFDYELRTCRNQWWFVQCIECDHVRLDPRPVVSALTTIYPAHYYAYNFAGQVHPLAVRGKAWLDRRKMASIRQRLPRPVTSYLDVGCGDGRFLRAMEQVGLNRSRLYGLELDRRIADRLRGEGYQVDCARVEDSSLIADGALDLITMFHVIEHVDRPDTIVAKLARWLAPGGVLAIETPNRDSLDARFFQRTFWGGYHFPRHWHLFTTEGLLRLLAQSGLEPAGVAYQTGHSFWLYSLHHWLRYGPLRMPRVARLFDPIGALLPLILATGFDKLRAIMRFRTSAVLVLARKPVSSKGMGVAIP
jgi:SAM-dependent methyltransferase